MIIGAMTSFCAVGCHRQASAVPPKTLGEAVTLLRASLVTASPQVQSNFYHGVSMGIRYGDYAGAEFALEQVGDDPSLTGPQKQLVAQVSNLVKQADEQQQNSGKPGP